MEEVKEENVLNKFRVRGEGLHNALDKVDTHVSDILVFNVQWKDLNKYLESVQGKLKERFKELESKEVELKGQSFGLEERAKVVVEAEAKLGDLEVKSDGLRMEVEERKKELNFLTQKVEVFSGESNAEEVRLTQLRTLVKECEAEQVLKAKELHEMVESWRKTHLELGLKGEQLAKMETELERCSAEMESLSRTQTHMRQLDEEVERKTKDLALVQNKLAECEKLLKTSSTELIKTQDELECKRGHLGKMEAEIERHHVMVREEKEHCERTLAHSKEMEEEIERKRKDLSAVEKQLDSQQKLLETRSSELVSKEKELKVVSLDIDLREQSLISLSNEMESKAKELENVQRLTEERRAQCESLKLLIVERSEELVSKEKRLDEITEAIRKLSLEIAFEEKTLTRAQVFNQKLSDKQVLAERELDSTRSHLEICISEHESAKKELCTVKDTYSECLGDLEIKEKELKSVESILSERNKQVEEGEKRMQQLSSSSEELNKQLKLKQKEVCSMRKTIVECSCELEAKRKQRDQVQNSLADLTAEHKSEESQLNSVKQKIQDSLKDFKSKEKEQARLRASLMKREQRLERKEEELSAREEMIDNKAQQLKSTEKKLAKSSKKPEPKAKKRGNRVQRVDLVRDANVCDEKTLELLLRGHLKKRDQLHLDVLSSVKRSPDPSKLVLDTLNGLYSAHQRMSAKSLDPNSLQRSSIFLLDCLIDMSPKPTTEVQEEAIKLATEWKNTTLVEAENTLEVLEFLHFLAAFSLAYTFDADQVQSLFDVAFLRKYGPSLFKVLGVSAPAPPVINVLSLEDTPEEQPPEAPIINSTDPCSSDVQQSIASSHLPNEDTLRDFEDSTYFSPSEVVTGLPVFKSPGRFVLNAVEDALTDARLRGELSLKEPMLMNLVPLLEELARVVPSTETDPRLENDAARVARRWVKMMGKSVEKLQLEAWAFLQFMVAFGLVLKLTNQDQTLQFASRVAHFKQAPKLFQSLGLSDAIPSFVTQLLDKAIYIPAIRFMFYFKVENNFSPLEFLKEQIINLTRSAKEKRRDESQAEEANREGATLREMMELIEDFQLEIDIPVALILKFMVPRVIVSSSSVPARLIHMQASEADIQSSCIATDGLDPIPPTSFGSSPNQPVNVETYQAGGSVAFRGQSSHQAGSKRPRVVDPEGPRPVIRPCFNQPPGIGRF